LRVSQPNVKRGVACDAMTWGAVWLATEQNGGIRLVEARRPVPSPMRTLRAQQPAARATLRRTRPVTRPSGS
jgi:hypothetical protein